MQDDSIKYNIALLHYSCPPVVGGVEEIVRQQSSVFTRYYHNVKVFAGKGSFVSEICEVEINPLLGSQNKDILEAQKLSSESRPGKMKQIINEIYNYLAESLKGFDVLIAHNVLTMPYNLPLSLALCRIAQKGLIPLISWNHDSPYFYPSYQGCLELFPWNTLKKPHPGIHYVVISKSREKLFSELYGNKCHLHVVPNGIDPIRFSRLDPLTVKLIQEQNLFEAEFIMVQPSRLHPRKNMELSIRVTKALHDMGLGAKLIVTGAHDPHEPTTMDYYFKLEKLARELGVKEHILIMAEYMFQSGEKLSADRIIMRDLYLISDILFLPSFQEGFGIPLLESGMIKLPVVCSNIPPFQEIGQDDALFFDLTDSPENIAENILKFSEKPGPQGLFRRVIRNYAWDNIYREKLLPLVAEVTGTR